MTSLPVNFCRVQTTMLRKKVQQPQPQPLKLPKQSPPASTSQAKNPTGQLVPLPPLALANRYFVSTIPKPNYQDHPLANPVIVQP